MVNLVVGVGQVSLLLRHARSLKDKRNALKSLKDRLRNQGFSVTECAYEENAKQASLGFACVGTSATLVQHAVDEGLRLFIGDYEVLATHSDVFDYTGEEEVDFEAAEENDPRS